LQTRHKSAAMYFLASADLRHPLRTVLQAGLSASEFNELQQEATNLKPDPAKLQADLLAIQEDRTIHTNSIWQNDHGLEPVNRVASRIVHNRPVFSQTPA